MRKNYKPNFIPLKTRVWLLIGVVFLLLFTLAEFAIGYTFLSGKRGGVLLSGIPTFMVAFASLSLCLAAFLTIVDHYDKRPNEHHYLKEVIISKNLKLGLRANHAFKKRTIYGFMHTFTKTPATILNPLPDSNIIDAFVLRFLLHTKAQPCHPW